YTLLVEGWDGSQGRHGVFTFQPQQVVAPTLGVPDSKGTDFWVAFPYTYLPPPFLGGLIPARHMALMITSDVHTSGSVFIGKNNFKAAFTVEAGRMTVVILPQDTDLGANDGVENGGIHIMALNEVSVYGTKTDPFAFGMDMMLPADAVGTQYVVQ